MTSMQTYEEVYSVPFSAPSAEIDTMMAKRRPPTGPANARPKSRPTGEKQSVIALHHVRWQCRPPMVVVAVACADKTSAKPSSAYCEQVTYDVEGQDEEVRDVGKHKQDDHHSQAAVNHESVEAECAHSQYSRTEMRIG